MLWESSSFLLLWPSPCLRAGSRCAGIGASAYALWLLPGAVATAACVVGSGFLMILSLFSIVLPCPRSAGLEAATILLRSGEAMAVYGTGQHHRQGRDVVQASPLGGSRSSQASTCSMRALASP